MTADRLIQTTESLCPICLKVLPADIIKRGDEVFMHRTCPEHGLFEEAIWRGQPDFETWRRPKKPAVGVRTQREADRGCPYDCGLCSEHGQHPCTILFEITRQCNLRCPICFANSGDGEKDFTPLPQLLEQMRWFHGQTGGEVVLQLSGGEPTLHPDLPALVAEGARLFPAVQLNTNGLKLAEDPTLPRRLAEAGLSWVFLQFDGVSDRSFEIIRGRPLLEKKMAAIAACAEVGLSVVLVPTVAAGVNDGELGDLVRLAVNLAPTVRGVHIQPMTSAGRNRLPGPQTGPYSDEGRSGHNRSSGNGLGRLAALHRLTLPEVLQRLAEQT